MRPPEQAVGETSVKMLGDRKTGQGDMSLISEWNKPLSFNKTGDIIWTPREDQRLMNSYKKIPKDRLLTLFPDRTWLAIKKRVNDLDIPRRGRHFSHEEDELLETLYYNTDLKYPEMIRFFKFRGSRSLNVRMGKLRKRGTPWGPTTSTSICIIHIPDVEGVDGVDKITVTRWQTGQEITVKRWPVEQERS